MFCQIKIVLPHGFLFNGQNISECCLCRIKSPVIIAVPYLPQVFSFCLCLLFQMLAPLHPPRRNFQVHFKHTNSPGRCVKTQISAFQFEHLVTS